MERKIALAEDDWQRDSNHDPRAAFSGARPSARCQW